MADFILIGCLCAAVAMVIILLAVLLYVLTPRSTIPGPSCVPLLGNLLELRNIKVGEQYEFYLQLARQYGDFYRLFFGRQQVIRLNTVEIIREAFIEKADVFSGTTDYLQNEGKGFLCAYGEDYKSLRKEFVGKIKGFNDIVSDKRTYESIALSEIRHLKDHINLVSDKPIETLKLLTAANLNIMIDILYGLRFNYEDETMEELVKAHATFSKELPKVNKLGLLFPFLKPVLPKLEKSSSQLHLFKYTETQMKRCRNTFDESNIRGLLDMFIQAEKNGEISGEAFSEKNILCALYDCFISAANIGVILSWCVIYMIRFPEIQKKCRDEIHKIIGKERTVRLSDRNKLSFVQATITEIGRQYPAVPITIPRLATDNGTLRGHFVPKGTVLIGDMFAIYAGDQRGNATLNPEKHLTSSGEFKLDYDIAFGIGSSPRRCIGESIADTAIFLTFANLLQQFSFTKWSETEDYNVKGYLGFVMAPPPHSVKIKRVE